MVTFVIITYILSLLCISSATGLLQKVMCLSFWLMVLCQTASSLATNQSQNLRVYTLKFKLGIRFTSDWSFLF